MTKVLQLAQVGRPPRLCLCGRRLAPTLDVCQEQGLEPYKHFSGKFITRVQASLHERITTAATVAGMSLNQWVQSALEREAAHG